MYINTHSPIEVGTVIKRQGVMVKVIDNTVTSTGCITEIEEQLDDAKS